jgi:DNA-binding CsgD family transcriptional regulator
MGRSDHDRAIAGLLDVIPLEPSALLIEGEPGIGKTTAWCSSIEEARSRGFAVLSMRADVADSVAAYAGLGDLLRDVGDDFFDALPPPQQRAINRVLLKAETGLATEPHTVAAAFLTVVSALAKERPLLIAIDDLQWADPSTAFAVGYLARRLPAGAGILATRRTDDTDDAATWTQMPKLRRIVLQPFTLPALAELLRSRLDHPVTRSDVKRINQLSGGNPFYAIELGLAIVHGSAGADLPRSLSALVQARVGGLDAEVRKVLLGAAALAAPTIDALAAALDLAVDRVAVSLEEAETAGIVGIAGNRVRFTHPLLAYGVYSQASPAARRATHRQLAAVVDQPEQRARHLALGATSADPKTIEALDEAAASARIRGAPAAAAELLDLAIGLGADTPERRIRAAEFHFDGGGVPRARSMLEDTITMLAPGRLRAAAANLLATIVMWVDGFRNAATVLEEYIPEAADDAGLSISMLIAFAFTLLNLGRTREALGWADEAVVRAERFGQPALLSRALGLRVVLGFMSGQGVDQRALARALALDDGVAAGPVALLPAVQHALLRAWTGHLGAASHELRSIQRLRLDDGAEGESMFLSYHLAHVAIWRGDFDEARRIAQDTIDSAAHLEGDIAVLTGLTIQSTLHAYAGRIDEARQSAMVALEASVRVEGTQLGGVLIANLGFIEVSLGNYQAALDVLGPIVDMLLAEPAYTEIIVASGVPDAVEAMVRTGRLSDAEHLTKIVEDNGRRLDRPWMLAVGGRCRGMVVAARGDVVGGVDALEAAMSHHDRLAMPFERARTQLELGALRRRLRQKNVAAADIGSALNEFERLNTPLWAARAGRELARVTVQSSGAGLTTTEQRVAELVADGLSNRAVASALLISPKTVGAHLANIYRKLDVHSRTELARWISNGKR